ncbi:MAG: putative bifunctional diguanylate cyclase/phosphodiesterase [Rhizobiaceae bacterium]
MARLVARDLEQNFEKLDDAGIDVIVENTIQYPEMAGISVTSRDLRRNYRRGELSGGGPNEISPASLNTLKSAAQQILVTKEGLQVGEPMFKDGLVIGSVMVEFKNPQMLEVMFPILKTNLTSTIPITLAGVLFCLGLLTQLTAPLLRLSEEIRNIAKGTSSGGVEVEGPLEVSELGNSVNDLISATKSNIDEIHELAYVDPTTRLPNREYFRNELTRAICRAVRINISGAVLFVDLDGFKKVNDTLGHDFGDKLLAAFAARISKIVRVDDTVAFPGIQNPDQSASDEAGREKQVLARLGGDEFTILLGEIREETDAAQVARRIISSTARPYLIDDKEIRVGVSVGIATFPRDGADYSEVLRSADMAMYLAKEEGKSTYRFFSEELNERASLRVEVENDLRVAIVSDQLELYLQPKVDCESGVPVSLEALLRWHHPEKGMVQPGEFIKIAEESGLIVPLGDWVLREACTHINRLEKLNLDYPVSVNISAQQFDQEDFSNRVLQIVQDSGIEARHLEIEITESMAMNNPTRSIEHFAKLKRSQIRIAVDDFGTGFSNLSQLSRLPFDVFKIDRSFIEGICDDHDNHGKTIVRTILAMAKSLDYETVAEGVENEDQRQFLAELGCDYAQGFLFAKPMPAGQAIEWLGSNQSRRTGSAKVSGNSKKSRAA